jgi:hypothetical protein
MSNRISFFYSHALTKKVAKRVWLQYQGRAYIFWIMPIFIASVMYLISSRTEQLSHSEVFGFGVLIGALSILVFQFGYIYSRSIERSALTISKKLNGTELLFNFDEQGVYMECAEGSTNFFWRAFNRLWMMSDVWLLCSSDQDYLLLPAQLLDADLREFIIQKVTESGGKIE